MHKETALFHNGIEHGVRDDELLPTARIEQLVGLHAPIATDGHVHPQDRLGGVARIEEPRRDDTDRRPQERHGQYEPLVPHDGVEIPLPIALLLGGRWGSAGRGETLRPHRIERCFISTVPVPTSPQHGNARLLRIGS